MKSVFLVLIIGGLVTSCNAQRIEVPAVVSAAFTANHPAIKKVAWELEDNGNYEAEFKTKKSEVSETYSAAGKLIETEREIKKKELPAAIIAAIDRDFSGHEIEEAAIITYPDGRTAYEVELEGEGDVTFDAIFNGEGKLLEKKMKEVKL